MKEEDIMKSGDATWTDPDIMSLRRRIQIETDTSFLLMQKINCLEEAGRDISDELVNRFYKLHESIDQLQDELEDMIDNL